MDINVDANITLQVSKSTFNAFKADYYFEYPDADDEEVVEAFTKDYLEDASISVGNATAWICSVDNCGVI